ncbi:streptomycin biosynthesis protein StrI [Byssothecium circinans]|uniref:Streptomycin biosynthesis protein StrI n=1 Tax=Byssothecium circinans TaxID=147558 RepID=A0A6A5U1N1_9PLEO|nr:streptomycin biosynthesis protein StrI [Byssothecium circinans]
MAATTINGLPPITPSAPRILIIGAGSRGHAYAKPISVSRTAHIVGVCEPDHFKRTVFGEQYIWGPEERSAREWEAFDSWSDWIEYEEVRQARVEAREVRKGHPEFERVDAVIVCVLDELHVHVCKALAPLNLHVLCEKPLAISLGDVVGIYDATTRAWEKNGGKKTIFGICHVLRYSPHNMLLRKLVREEGVIGNVLSIEHTEPVGWWHFSHSYVRGNWRRKDTSAPSILTKSCHDIDFLLWLLCSPAYPTSTEKPHFPSTIASSGTLNLFRKAHKPKAAGSATNCLSCPVEKDCIYSAKRIYVDLHFNQGDMEWPVKVVVPDIGVRQGTASARRKLRNLVPDIEDISVKEGNASARQKLLDVLAEDYPAGTPDANIKDRNWFGRCVWECDNDVFDDQHVTITWDDDPLPTSAESTNEAFAPEHRNPIDNSSLNHRAAKTAYFHMTANTQVICERRGRIYGTRGEIAYDSTTITVHDFATGLTATHWPKREGGGHGGGDLGLASNFVRAVQAVKNGEVEAEGAQKIFLGCSFEEVIRSHVAVFAAEEAVGKDGSSVRWSEYWKDKVKGK